MNSTETPNRVASGDGIDALARFLEKHAGPGRKLIFALDDRWGYMAILDFGVLDLRIGGNGETPEAALEALEANLTEDAADEMVKAGVV